MVLAAVALPAHAFELQVVGPDGIPIPGGYRWLVQEDTTKDSKPGDPAVPGQHLSLSFHSSYAPVVAKGDTSRGETPNHIDPTGKRYFISVLPHSAGADGGYTIGGGPVMAEGATTITVNKLPLPTAQISVFIFEDNNPINNAPDLPGEHGLPGFTVQVFEAGGSYGANGGRMLYDAFGNPLGTTYSRDAEGNMVVETRGSGVITTDDQGVARIENLAPGKYTLFVEPPAGEGWVQTATIEGTPGIDAWVKANEPSYFQEFGAPGHHVFVGFVRPIRDTSVLTGGSTITGRVVNQHMSRAPEYAFYNGEPVERCWVGLNELAAAPGKAIYAAPCNSDSTFAIDGVPQGMYQLVVWDELLDVIFASHTVEVPEGGGEVALMDVPVFNWFGRLKGSVFYDSNGNGFPDVGEMGMPNQAVNLRFRDGSIYQMQATDAEGDYEFKEVFPFFNWLVAEVDFARYKATGITVAVDAGGPVGPTLAEGIDWSYGMLTPQPQSEQDGQPYRTETGPVLTQGMQVFLGQTNVIHWGKQLYDTALREHGGISGMVYYATTRAEDDPRYAAVENWEPGIPNVRVNLYRAGEDGKPTGPVIMTTLTDSWDESNPENCQGDNMMDGIAPNLCFDGLRNFNQVRPALFDGGYAFTTMWQFDEAGERLLDDKGEPIEAPLPPGNYVVEAVAPSGYEHVKEEDKNVDFGDTYVPSPLALPQVCVGDDHLVPDELSLFPHIASPFAGQWRPLCDRKLVRLGVSQNAATDFFMFTEVPVAGQIVGMILNDLANEFDPNAPNFGEKYAPPHMPISIRDWTGREIHRVYSDAYGTYNALVPSTYTLNAPMPSGVSPSMLTVCLNSPMMPDPMNPGRYIPDPHFNRQYTQFCYTFQYMPGKTTYLDTPVLPIAAMAGRDRFPLDCEYADGTPMIHSVTNADGQGPWLPAGGNRTRNITITSLGQVEVLNPAYNGSNAKTVWRDYGFGTDPGTVTFGGSDLDVIDWSDGTITAAVPRGARTDQLVVTRANGQSTTQGVTLTVGGQAPTVVGPNGSIQKAIDEASDGDLITVAPGVYEELVIMHKPVRLQGWGPGSVTLNAVKAPAEKLHLWRETLASLYRGDAFDLLPGQVLGEVDPQNNEPVLFNTDEGAGITVVANIREFRNHAPRIDGFTITGADHGGGIYVNGYANDLEIANNRIISNQGYFGGGIHVGNPLLINDDAYVDSANPNIRIHHNQITQNGSLAGAGGGISLYKGATGYEVADNFVCGNLALGGGGGIAHLGASANGVIRGNTVIFNESFNQARTVSGGGILIAGQPALVAGQLSEGSGKVTVERNLIQGNLAGAGDGGGIRVQFANASELNITNNMIVNNIAGLAGGGISLQDASATRIVHNTIAHNDSTATAGDAFRPGSPNQSEPQPAGIVSHSHSNAFAPGCTRDCFSDPVLDNNIIWQNRSFYWRIDPLGDPDPTNPPFGLVENRFWDLAVIGTSGALEPRYSVLTDTAGYGGTNVSAAPNFVAAYFNDAPGQTIQQPELTVGISTAAAFDEGGNFIDINFGPLSLNLPVDGAGNPSDYHLGPDSSARDLGAPNLSDVDFDGDPRPRNTPLDAGADEVR